MFLSYGAQSLHLLQFDIQSRTSSLAFRVTISLQFCFQSHHPIAIGHSLPLFRHSEPPSFLSYGVQNHHLFTTWRLESSSFSIMAFRATFQAFEVMIFQSLSSSLVHDIALWAYSLCFDCIIGAPHFALLYGACIVSFLYMFLSMLLDGLTTAQLWLRSLNHFWWHLRGSLDP